MFFFSMARNWKILTLGYFCHTEHADEKHAQVDGNYNIFPTSFQKALLPVCACVCLFCLTFADVSYYNSKYQYQYNSEHISFYLQNPFDVIHIHPSNDHEHAIAAFTQSDFYTFPSLKWN